MEPKGEGQKDAPIEISDDEAGPARLQTSSRKMHTSNSSSSKSKSENRARTSAFPQAICLLDEDEASATPHSRSTSHTARAAIPHRNNPANISLNRPAQISISDSRVPQSRGLSIPTTDDTLTNLSRSGRPSPISRNGTPIVQPRLNRPFYAEVIRSPNKQTSPFRPSLATTSNTLASYAKTSSSSQTKTLNSSALSDRDTADTLEGIFSGPQNNRTSTPLLHRRPSNWAFPPRRDASVERMESLKTPPATTPAAPKAWICENCAEDSIGCDGEIPCSNCAEPGLSCYYPGRPHHLGRENPIATKTPQLSSSKGHVDDIGSHGGLQSVSHQITPVGPPRSARSSTSNSFDASVLMESDEDDDEAFSRSATSGSQPEASSRGLSTANDGSDSRLTSLQPSIYGAQGSESRPNGLQPSNAGVDGSEYRLTSVQPSNHEANEINEKASSHTMHRPSTPIPLESEAVEALVKRYESEMNAHRAYILPPALRQARVDMRKNGPSPFQDVPDPFAALRALTIPITEDAGIPEPVKGPKLQIQTKTFNKTNSKDAKWKSIIIPVRNFQVEAVSLPKYKSIGRLPSTTLVRNYHTLKYWPYFAEDDLLPDDAKKKKTDELEARHNADMPQLTNQRRCKELVDMWRPWVDDILEELEISFVDVCYYLLHEGEPSLQLGFQTNLELSAKSPWIPAVFHQCSTCDQMDLVDDSIRAVMREEKRPEDRKLAMAGILCHVFPLVTKLTLWHFGSSSPSIRKLVQERRLIPRLDRHHVANVLCLVCYRHYCPTHGAYKDDDKENTFESGDIKIDNMEAKNNLRQSVTLPPKPDDSVGHDCGIFCGDPDTPLTDLFGLMPDGPGGAIRCLEVSEGSSMFKDDEDCGANCFYTVVKRPSDPATIKDVDDGRLSWLTELPPSSLALFEAMMPLFVNNKRGPCIIANAMKRDICLNVFYAFVNRTNATSHNHEQLLQVQASKLRATTRPLLNTIGFEKNGNLDQRPVFVPCCHAGPCQGNAECSCFTNKVVCEWFCGCDMSCKRRYQGCTCAPGSKDCCTTKICACYFNNRECDPHLCGPCGVAEILDPVNRYDDEARKHRCRNNRLQLGIPKRTNKGPSEVQGWGLFAGQDIAKWEYIGEYKGEVVSVPESDRRGVIYHNIGQEYLFNVNNDQEIDASLSGNKMRFMNNSARKDYINVYAHKLLCNGVARIGLYAKKDIKAGDELLYDYNYPVEVAKKFWEKGEGPASGWAGAGPVTAARKGSAQRGRNHRRFAKSASGQERGAGRKKSRSRSAVGLQHEHSGQPASGVNRRKRKFISDSTMTGGSGSTETAGSSLKTASSSFEQEPVIEATDEESEFEASGAASEDSASEDHLESESEEEEESDDSGVHKEKERSRQRAIQPGDRRLGGQVQRAAWETRKRNMLASRAGALGGRRKRGRR